MKKIYILLTLCLTFAINGCWCTYDITYEVSSPTATNVDIVCHDQINPHSRSGVDLTSGTWKKTFEITDFWEEECEEDDPYTPEDESSSIYCQDEDETFPLSITVTNRDGAPHNITVKIVIDNDTASKQSEIVSPSSSIHDYFYLDDM